MAEQIPTPPDLPMGFGMALAQDPAALETFSDLSPEQRRRVIDQTQAIESREQMQLFVRNHFHFNLS